MSQLFVTFGINWQLLLIQAVNFAVLLVGLWYFLYGPIMRIIDERREKIAEGVRTAEAAAHRLEEAKTEGDTMVGNAGREAEALVATARARADEKGNQMIKEAQSRADKMMVDAEARAGEAKRQAILESEKEIARTAMMAAEKILRQKSA
jgi:F-type H+-transporting ATPase subunit b